MRILGMVTHTHDSGVALIENGVPDMVIEEERLNRQKKTQQFPAQQHGAEREEIAFGYIVTFPGPATADNHPVFSI